MSITDLLTPICLVLLLYFYIRTSQTLRHAVLGEKEHTPLYLQILYTAAIALPIMILCARYIPLPVFYLLLYGTSCLTVILGQEKEPLEWLFINLQFLILTAPHLIIISILALCTGMGALDIVTDFHLRTISLALVILLNILFFYILMHKIRHSNLPRIQPASEEVRLFSKFIWFCACSVVFDSITCRYSLPAIFPLIFMLGSNLLLLLMAILFAHHVYTILRDSYLKEEAMCLREEAIARHIHNTKLEQTAFLDTLTNIYTRRYALNNMSSMLKSGESFALAFLDLDGLKQVNDKQGHIAGDKYLQTFCSRMKERLRPNDIFIRYGGDEFLILMPDLTKETADTQLKHIQTDASAAQPQGWGTPFSFGLANAQPDAGIAPDEWISMADHAMYDDKMRRKIKREDSR